jgi:hypothetical protein
VIDWIWEDPLADDDESGSMGFNEDFESDGPED